MDMLNKVDVNLDFIQEDEFSEMSFVCDEDVVIQIPHINVGSPKALPE